MKLLIVEDNPKMRLLIKAILGTMVDEVDECSDGDEAAAAYAAFHPDWVLMDLHMTRMGGIEATRRIIAADPAARIIIVTQYDDQYWRAAAESAGACGYVLKENLIELRKFLEKTVNDEDYS